MLWNSHRRQRTVSGAELVAAWRAASAARLVLAGAVTVALGGTAVVGVAAEAPGADPPPGRPAPLQSTTISAGGVVVGVSVSNASRGELGAYYEGVYGESDHFGVVGHGASIGTVGVVGAGAGGVLGGSGIAGESPSGPGVYGRSTTGIGVQGQCDGAGDGVYGWSDTGAGVHGVSWMADGVFGEATAVEKSGIFALNTNPNGYAGYFTGRVHVNGALTKASGAFKIDHPLDPENMYLYHSFVESPDMKNIYDGVVALDAGGGADVELPSWFEALNRDFRYQLTAIGAAMPGLHVAAEVADNRFSIAGGVPGMKVSWQVTGVRKDPWAEAHRILVEQEKPEIERGTYLHPAEWRQPQDKDVQWVHRPELMERLTARQAGVRRAAATVTRAR